MDLIIRPRAEHGPGQQPLEVVERKGIGHPDTICDGIAEHVSQQLCRYYLERFGAIQHHNVDKVLLCGGAAHASYGGGEVVAPIEIYLAGRATDEVRGELVPTAEIAIAACKSWLGRHLPELDLARQVRIIPRLHPGAASLTALFARGSAVPLANDTSCAAGFAPLTDLERVVLEVERCLNAPETKREHPAIGWDIKLMGVRNHARVDLTIACALVARHIADAGAYLHAKETVRALAVAAAERVTGRLEINAVVNAADDIERGEVYLTVTGTSAESGDDGEVGRGNRCSGLITPYRPMTMEAAAGKNPVSHVGKLYNLAAQRLSASLCEHLPDVKDATCRLVSKIGNPLDQPTVVDVELGVASERIGSLLEPAERLVRAVLGDLGGLRRALLEGHVRVY
jgi:S-adenosylmethionine synthetase